MVDRNAIWGGVKRRGLIALSPHRPVRARFANASTLLVEEGRSQNFPAANESIEGGIVMIQLPVAIEDGIVMI